MNRGGERHGLSRIVTLRGLLAVARHHARGTVRPEPGRQPARITYLTVETSQGNRVLTLSTNQRAGDVDASRRMSHQENTDACCE